MKKIFLLLLSLSNIYGMKEERALDNRHTNKPKMVIEDIHAQAINLILLSNKKTMPECKLEKKLKTLTSYSLEKINNEEETVLNFVLKFVKKYHNRKDSIGLFHCSPKELNGICQQNKSLKNDSKGQGYILDVIPLIQKIVGQLNRETFDERLIIEAALCSPVGLRNKISDLISQRKHNRELRPGKEERAKLQLQELKQNIEAQSISQNKNKPEKLTRTQKAQQLAMITEYNNKCLRKLFGKIENMYSNDIIQKQKTN